MNKEEAIKELKKLLNNDDDYSFLYNDELEAIKYAIHFLESAEEVKK